MEEEVAVVDELQEEEVVVEVEEVLEEVVEAGRSPSMSAALWECDRQRALMGSKPSCGEREAQVRGHPITLTCGGGASELSPAGASDLSF